MKRILQLANKIKLVIFDVDGVLTDGSLFYDNHGQEYKAFNSRDGHGMRMLQDGGIEIAIITGRESDLVQHRAQNLKLKPDLIFQGYRDKRPAFNEIMEKTGFSAQQIAYVGDDVVDLPIMSQVGMAIAVNDAHPFVCRHADWVTQNPGGRGAVREVCELVLESKGMLDIMLNSYLQG